MILNKVTFGPVPPGRRQEAEDVVESYICVLLHNGQAVGEYFHCLQGGELCAYVNLAGIKALSTKYQSTYTADRLAKVMAVFQRKPRWTVADDEAPKRDSTWAGAPFLYLFTHRSDWESPLCRGDNGQPIPLYRLPGAHEDREAIYFWQNKYRELDAIWISCGHLEIPAYRELALPASELSREGLEICQKVELATGVPTYYYLMRHWGRTGEENRRCPGCGRPWRTDTPVGRSARFCEFAFRCRHCKLVAHLANSFDDARHARIGEWKEATKRSRESTVRVRRR